MKAFLRKHLDDVLILAGCGLVVFATWLLSWIAAIYAAGGILIVLGVLVGIGERATPAAQERAGTRPAPTEGNDR